MKHILIVFFTLLCSLSAVAQIQTAQNSPVKGYNASFFTQAAAGGFTDNGSGSFTGTLNPLPELTGYFSFSLDNLQVGDILISGGSTGIYEITAINTPGTNPNIDIQLLQDLSDLPEPMFGFPASPSDPISIARPTGNCGLIPSYVFASTGLDGRTKALIENYNMNRQDECSGGGVGNCSNDFTGTTLQVGDPVNTSSTDATLTTFDGITVPDGVVVADNGNGTYKVAHCGCYEQTAFTYSATPDQENFYYFSDEVGTARDVGLNIVNDSIEVNLFEVQPDGRMCVDIKAYRLAEGGSEQLSAFRNKATGERTDDVNDDILTEQSLYVGTEGTEGGHIHARSTFSISETYLRKTFSSITFDNFPISSGSALRSLVLLPDMQANFGDNVKAVFEIKIVLGNGS
ncbi:MAG: hypothetical protein AAF599_09630, partial [Bacteroidota bacterium]